MIIDHVGFILFPQSVLFRIIGRLSMPLFAFTTGQGFRHSKNIKNYIFLLFLFGCISQPIYSIFFRNGNLNIFFELLLGVIALLAYRRLKNKTHGFITVLLFGIIATALNFEYGFYGILTIFIFGVYEFKNHFTKIAWYFAINTLIYVFVGILLDPEIFSKHYLWSIIQVFSIPSLLLIMFYNGHRGPSHKYLFYILYPLHLLILLLVKPIV